MFKRVILVLACLLLFLGPVFAAPVTIMDPGGQTQASVRDGLIGAPRSISRMTGSGQVYSGKCRLLGINMYSDTAGDLIGVYDTTDSGHPITTLEFEMALAANTSSLFVDLKGAPFSEGIRILATDTTNTITTVLFDY